MNVERTGWRDEWISGRHRTWGDCWATDIDWVVAEYTHCKPRALIEYKHYKARFNLDNASIRVIADLATNHNSPLPAFVVRYSPEAAKFGVIPLNDPAKLFVPELTIFGEADYQKLQAELRQ